MPDIRQLGFSFGLVFLAACAAAPSSPVLKSQKTASARWWDSAVVYEVYVRSFADADGDGHGDLAGLTAHLDDLQDGDPSTTSDLGVDALWLMPIHPSPSPHGYDVTDYKGVHPDYGTLADFDRLVAEAHKRGLRIVLDFVLNHTSSKHPWFEQARLRKRPFRSFYRFSDEDKNHPRPWDGVPTWHKADDDWFYALFWSEMPDLDLESDQVFQRMVEAARFWAARGVDGFRIDAARYLVEQGASLADTDSNHRLIKKFREAVDPQHELLWLAEVWTKSETVARYHEGRQFDRAFDFELASAIVASVKEESPAPVLDALTSPGRAVADSSFFAAFTDNHDRPRTASQGLDEQRLLLVQAVLLSWSSTVFLYYGQELGLPGSSGQGDAGYRTPMAWSDAPHAGFSTAPPWRAPGGEVTPLQQQRDRDDSLWRATQALIETRRRCAGPAEFSAIQEHGLRVTRGRCTTYLNLSSSLELTLPEGEAELLYQSGLNKRRLSAGGVAVLRSP